MRIGIDVRMWSEKGIGRYIRGLVTHLRDDDRIRSQQIVFFCLSKNIDEIKTIWNDMTHATFVTCDVRWYTVREQFEMPLHYYRQRLDLLHVPHFNISLGYFGKTIVTIHDLTHELHAMRKGSRLPTWLYLVKQTAYKLVFRVALMRSEQIITVSRFVQEQLMQRYAVAEKRIHVIYEAADACSKVTSDQLIRLLDEYGVTKKYFYYIGNAHPHKNLEFLLRAFSEYRKKYPDYQLVLSGDDEYFWPRLRKFAVYEDLSENIVFTGKVDDRVKDTLLKGACAYIFPSLSEGFGLPLLEAMQCGCPILAAKATSLPEIAQDAALYFDPTIVDSVCDAMKTISTNESLRQQLIVQGAQRSNQFSWTMMSEQTLSIYLQN